MATKRPHRGDKSIIHRLTSIPRSLNIDKQTTTLSSLISCELRPGANILFITLDVSMPPVTFGSFLSRTNRMSLPPTPISWHIWRQIATFLAGPATYIEQYLRCFKHKVEGAARFSNPFQKHGNVAGDESPTWTATEHFEPAEFCIVQSVECHQDHLKPDGRLKLIDRMDAICNPPKQCITCAWLLLSGDSSKISWERFLVEEHTLSDSHISYGTGTSLTDEEEYGYVDQRVPDVETESVNTDFWEWNADKQVFQHWDEQLGEMIVCPDTLD